MKIRNTLICTVGTSLFESNLKNLSAQTPDPPENWQAIRQAYDQKNWKELAEEISKVKPCKRICGAEINTIEETKRKKWLDLQNLIFLVSDTDNGKNTGEFLQHYFEMRQDLGLNTIEYRIVDRLQDECPVDFKVHGLRNLVRRMGEYIQRFGGAECVAIDATGGYKAQIAIAVIVGQALNMPVFYKHEKFSEIIDFPPLPIAFDYEILARNAALLTDFERGETFSAKELGELDEKLRVLLTEVEVECLPTAIPESIRVDVDSLEVNEFLHVRDLKAPEGVKILSDPEEIVAAVHPAKVTPEAAPAAEEITEPEVIGEKKREEAEEEEEEK